MPKNQIIIRDETLRQRAIELIYGLNLDKPWTITVEPFRKKRSLSQLRLMHAWIGEVVKHVSEHTGYTHDDVHEFLKQKFLTPKTIEIDGRVSRRWTTGDLTTAQMADYMDKIYAWATTELGLFLPIPELREAA